MQKYNILHVSPTPLVGSPSKISEALNLYTEFNSSYFMFNDYPNALKGLFSNKALNYSKKRDRVMILRLIEEADIIHVHNFLDKEQEDILFNNSRDDNTVKFIYQVHSPLREGPTFVNYEPNKLCFDKKCVISQYHPRLYPNYRIVPNLVLEKPTLNLINDNEIPKVLFSPAHKRVGGRWNDKYSTELITVLDSLSKIDKIELFLVDEYTPYELFELRKQCHISIDEIVTGSFHQISLEGLCAGNLVINNSDTFSNLVLSNLVNSSKEIPFFKVNNYNVQEKLYKLVDDKRLIREYQKRSFEYFTKYLKANLLVKEYEKLYVEVLNDI